MAAELVTSIVPAAALLAINIFALATLMAVARLLKGPTLPDRVVALDLIASLAVGVMVLYSILSEQPMLLRTAVVVALVVFVGTAAFAMYLERRGQL